MVRRSRLRFVLRWGIVSLGLGLLLLQTPVGATWTARAVARALVPDGLQVELARVGWFPISSLNLDHVVLTDHLGQNVFSASHIAIHHQLTALFTGRPLITSLEIDAGRLTLQDRPGGGWGLLPSGGRSAESPPPGSDRPAQPVSVRLVEIRNSRIDVIARGAGRSGHEWADTTVALEDLDARIGELVFGPEGTVFGRIEEAAATGRLGVAPREYSARLTVAGGLRGYVLELDTVNLNSPHSQVDGRLRVAWGGPVEDEPVTLEGRLSSSGVASQDIVAFAPNWLGETPVAFRSGITGPIDSLLFDLNAGAYAAGSLAGELVVSSGDSVPGLAWDLEVDTLDPRVVLGPQAAPGRVSGRTVGAVRGNRPQRWTGSLDVDLRQSAVGRVGLDRSRISLRFDDGQGDGVVTVDVRDTSAHLFFEGPLTARPFDSIPAYALSGHLRVSPIRGPVTEEGVHLLANLEGRGLKPATLTLGANLRSDSARATSIGRSALTGGTATLEVEAGQGRWALGADVGTGSVTAAGSLQVADDAYSVRATKLTWDALDIAALLGDTVASRMSGSAAGTIEGGQGRLLGSTGGAQISELAYGDLSLDTAWATWSLEKGSLLSDFTALVDSGRAELRLEGNPQQAGPSIWLARGSVTELDLGAPLPSSDSVQLSTRLTGAFSGSLEGHRLSDGRTDISWQLQQSRVQGLDSLSGQGNIRGRQGELFIDASVVGPVASMDAVARLSPFRDIRTWSLEEVVFVGVRLGDFFEVPTDLPVVLTGTLQGSGTGFAPAEAAGTLALTLDGSRIGSQSVSQGRVDASFADEQVDFDLDVGADAGRVQGAAWVRMDADSIEYGLAVDGRPRDDSTTVALRARVHGHGLTPSTLRANLAIDLESVALAGIELQTGMVRLSASEGRVHVDSFSVQGPALNLALGGTVGLAGGFDGDLRGDLTVSSLDLPSADLDARSMSVREGSVRMTLIGPADSSRFELSGSANGLSYGGLRLQGIGATAAGTLSSFRPTAGVASMALTGLAAPTVTVAQTRVDVDYEGKDIGIRIESDVDSTRTLRAAARLNRSTDSLRFEVERLAASLDGDEWELVAPTSILYGEVGVIDSLDLRADDQRIVVHGRWAPRGNQDLHIAIDRFRLGTVTDLVGLAGLQGTVQGSLDLTGTAREPRIAARYQSDLAASGGVSARVDGIFEYGLGRLTVDASVAQPTGGSLEFRSDMPGRLALPWSAEPISPLFAVGEGPIDLRIDAESLRLGWLQPFLAPAGVENLQGELSAAIRVEGTASTPRLGGSSHVRGGAVTIPMLGTTWRNIEGAATLLESSLAINSLHLESGDGALDAAGSVEFNQLTLGEFDIALRADAFRAVDNQLARATISGEGELSGTTAQPELSANVRLLSTDVYLGRTRLGSQSRNVTLSEADYEALEATFGRDFRAGQRTRLSLLDASALDITVALGRDTWVRQAANPELALQMTGELRLTKLATDSLQLLGQIEAIPQRSYIEQFGRRFQLTRGEVTFGGRPLDTRIDVQGAYEVPSERSPDRAEVTIRLGVEGTPERIDLLLDSEPTMENGDIVSYLATGRPAGQHLDLGGQSGGAITGVGADMAVGAVANAIEGAAAQRAGLDVIDIESDGLRGATLVAGRFVSPSLFVGFRQPITLGAGAERTSGPERRSEVELEYLALRWLLLNLQAGGRGFDFVLRSRVAY